MTAKPDHLGLAEGLTLMHDVEMIGQGFKN
jgi:hypothetical protein